MAADSTTKCAVYRGVISRHSSASLLTASMISSAYLAYIDSARITGGLAGNYSAIKIGIEANWRSV